ncbi:HNH endonuclease, partial [Rhodococcus sp. NPDC058514]
RDRCYLCKAPVTFVGTEIDHILPKTLPEIELESFKAKHLTPARAGAFDLNVAHNLAPICRKCNSDKSDTNFAGVPALAMWLNKAHEKQPAVEKFVIDLRSASGVRQAMGKLLGADFTPVNSKKCLAELGPALMDRFRSEAPAVLEAPSTHDYRGQYRGSAGDEPCFADGPLLSSVILDERSRRAKVVLEDVFGWDFDRALDVVVDAAAPEIRNLLAEKIGSKLFKAGHEDADVGSVDGFMSFVIVEMRFDVHDRSFLVRGSFEADGSAEAAVIDYQNDSGTVWGQWDADLTEGSFEVTLWEPLAEDLTKDGGASVMAVAGDLVLS